MDPCVAEFLGTAILSFETTHFAIANIILVVIWILIAVAIGREHAKLTKA